MYWSNEFPSQSDTYPKLIFLVSTTRCGLLLRTE